MGCSAGKSRGALLDKLGTATGRRGRTRASEERVDAAENKVERLQASLADLEQDLAEDVTAIEARWTDAATDITSLRIPLEKTDVRVTQLVLAWLPSRRRRRSDGDGRPLDGVCADGETRTLTDGDLNAVPLPIGLRRLTSDMLSASSPPPLLTQT